MAEWEQSDYDLSNKERKYNDLGLIDLVIDISRDIRLCVFICMCKFICLYVFDISMNIGGFIITYFHA